MCGTQAVSININGKGDLFLTVMLMQGQSELSFLFMKKNVLLQVMKRDGLNQMLATC